MSVPVVSVVMPAYNAEATVIAAIESVFAQTMRDLELIICDDASQDRTREILKSVTDSRLRIVSNTSNLGAGAARDRAISFAAAPWIAFIDADDAWRPDRLSRLLDVADTSNRELIFDDIMVCHDVDGHLIPWRPIHGRRGFGCKDEGSVSLSLETYLTSDRLIIQPLIPTSLIKQTNMRHSKRSFGEDAEYIIGLAAAAMGLRYLPEPLYLYRITPTSATARTADHSLMRKCIEDCLNSRPWPEHTVRAFREKISMLRANEVLYEVQDRVRKGRPFAAIGLLLSRPRALRIFPRRALKRAYYQMHRLLRGGVGR